MPTYVYRCEDCGAEIEVRQKMSDAPLTKCSKCSGKLSRVIFANGVIFKGSGYYTTDYAKPEKEKMNLLDNIYIILVEPLYAGNMGSTARAMKNMGLGNMILVSPREDHLSIEARKMAVSAVNVLEEAVVYNDLQAAVEDFSYLAATTTRKRKGFPHTYTAKGAASRILKMAVGGKTGIMFGREDKGLFNREIALATEIVGIPASHGLTSINLSQAVLIVCYEIFQKYNPDDVPEAPVHRSADVRAKEEYITHLESTLGRIGFFHSSSKDHIMYSIKDLLDRAFPSDRDIRIFRGILRQLEWYLDRDKGA